MPKLLPTSSTALVKADSILTIFAANGYLDADESAGVFNTTPTSSKEVVDKTLDIANYIFIRHLKTGWLGILDADVDPLALDTMGPEPKSFLPPGLKYLEEYAVENVHQETFLIAKEVKVPMDEQGRTQVAYNVQDLRGFSDRESLRGQVPEVDDLLCLPHLLEAPHTRNAQAGGGLRLCIRI
ncbi:hypothetical protein Fcan01_14182 [Folsomia candida]|uniref:Uncharacterized protein n=1 Tax=Folsomia candida TaxID=158441 RepID=A0A226E1V5_FOLCA|nr:hypothetical protein Fcan01_14182 [Folsomia candida]